MPPPRMSPPMEAPSSPKKKMSSTSIVLTVLGVLLGAGCIGGIFLVALLMPVFRRAQASAMRRRTCMSNLREIGVSMSMYSSEYDGQLPVAGKWMDQLGAAGLPHDRLKCPEVSAANVGGYGYAFNTALGKKRKAAVDGNTWLVEDSTLLERNANSASDTGPRPGRHPGMGTHRNNILMVNGSVRFDSRGR